MYEEFGREEVLQALDRLIERNAAVLEDEEGELQQVRGNWLTLTVKEHIVGSLSQEEKERRVAVLSRFREAQSRVDSQRVRLEKLRAARKDWEVELPSSLQNRFEDLLTAV
jgi:hypothetical protein